MENRALKTVRVVALKDHTYDSKPRKTGETYDVVIDPTAPGDMIAKLTAYGFAIPETTASKREYKRRDMTAENE